MTLVKEALLNWRPGTPEAASLIMVCDDADFDTRLDMELGLILYRRIMAVEVVCPRGLKLRIGMKQRALTEITFTRQTNRSIDLSGTRITEEGLRWDFTPAHVPVTRGSVSNPSLLTSGGNSANPITSDTTAAFTPTANGLLLTGWALRVNSDVATIAYTNTHTDSGAWSQVTDDGGTPNTVHHSQGRSQTGASPGSGTITGTYSSVGGTIIRTAWIVAEITGHDTTTPVSESNTGSASSGTSLSISIAGFTAGNNVISSVSVRDNTAITVGTGETELADIASGGTFPVQVQMQYSTDTAHDWAWTSDGANAGVVVEYAAAAAGGATPKGVFGLALHGPFGGPV